MTIETRFGQIEASEGDIVELLDGLIGFSNLRRFVLISHNPKSPFRWLQSLDETSMAFLVADPSQYLEDYQPEISDAAATALGLESSTPAMVYTTASIPKGSPRDLTLNLAAPIVINPATRVGMQVILENEAYTMKHRVFEESAQEAETQVA